jgi:hypothetical protein
MAKWQGPAWERTIPAAAQEPPCQRIARSRCWGLTAAETREMAGLTTPQRPSSVGRAQPATMATGNNKQFVKRVRALVRAQLGSHLGQCLRDEGVAMDMPTAVYLGMTA